MFVANVMTSHMILIVGVGTNLETLKGGHPVNTSNSNCVHISGFWWWWYIVQYCKDPLLVRANYPRAFTLPVAGPAMISTFASCLIPFPLQSRLWYLCAGVEAFPDDVHITEHCKDLMSRLLEIDPLKRITLESIKSHPWLAKEPAAQQIDQTNALVLNVPQVRPLTFPLPLPPTVTHCHDYPLPQACCTLNLFCLPVPCHWSAWLSTRAATFSGVQIMKIVPSLALID